MLTFQNSKNRDCRSADCSKRKYRIKRQHTQSNDNTFDQSKYTEKNNNLHNRQSYEAPLSHPDPFRQHMKFLIAQNSEYFQSKVKVTDKIRPNQYRFKIPTKTPSTVYKKHFQLKQKNLSVDNLKLNRNNLSYLIKQKDPDEKLIMKTSYQKQFILRKQTKQQNKENKKQTLVKKDHQEEKVPRFMDTQNQCFFLNWGGKNATTSLKPSYQLVGTNLPFEGKTVYKNDFQGKLVTPTKIIVPESSMSKFSGSMMINKSNYSTDFPLKQRKVQMQKSCKPKNVVIRGDRFKGMTQYKSQFMNIKDTSQDHHQRTKTRQQLHAFILDL